MAFHFSFRPSLVGALADYSGAKFVSDVFAGVTVGVIALPLAIAFAIASGLRPEAGIFTAIVAGFLISVFGGSKVQIGGPAGAFIVIVYGIVDQYGVANLLLATMLAGFFLFLMGLANLGALIRHIPVTIVIGFTNGIAVLIALSQIKDFLGLTVESVPAEFFAKVQVLLSNGSSFDPTTLVLGLVCLATIVFWPKTYAPPRNKFLKMLSHIPGTIVAVVVGTVAVRTLHLDVATIGTRFGGIPQTLPHMTLPNFDWQSARHVLAPAFTIALLSSIESLLCARVADGLIGERHDPSQELMGQGIANMVAPLFGGFCATGTIARTIANVRSGAVSPVAGVVHSLTLLVIVLVAAPLAQDIPLAALSAILLFVAYNMGEWKQFLSMRRFTMNYRAILLSTFVLTVVIDLTAAVEVGLVLSCLFFITRVTSLTYLEQLDSLNDKIEIFRLHGSLFFGSISKIEELLDPQRQVARVTVLDLSHLLNLDTTGLEALEQLHDILDKRGGALILCGPPQQPASLLHRSGFAQHLGQDHILSSLEEARAASTALANRE